MRQTFFVIVFCVCSSLTGCTDAPPPGSQAPIAWATPPQAAQLSGDFVPDMSETVYVPVYSHIYHEDKDRALLMVGNLSIRNTDPKQPLIVKAVRYFDTDGRVLQSLVDKPVVVNPFGTAEVIVPRTHSTGGSGANFVVEWMAAGKINEPLIEAVMVGTTSSQSVSFVSRGVVIKRTEGKAPTPPPAAH